MIPAGGGCKELYLRQLERSAGRSDVQAVLRRTFETIGMAKVATSGEEARDRKFLRPSDKVEINRDQQLWTAKRMAVGLAEEGYTPRNRPYSPTMREAGNCDFIPRQRLRLSTRQCL